MMFPAEKSNILNTGNRGLHLKKDPTTLCIKKKRFRVKYPLMGFFESVNLLRVYA